MGLVLYLLYEGRKGGMGVMSPPFLSACVRKMDPGHMTCFGVSHEKTLFFFPACTCRLHGVSEAKPKVLAGCCMGVPSA